MKSNSEFAGINSRFFSWQTITVTQSAMRFVMLLPIALFISYAAVAQQSTFSGKVLLQGAFDPGTALMRTLLVQQSDFQLQQPFNRPPWYHGGTESLSILPTGIVDWILVDLRTSPDTAIARKAAILYSDGSIRDASGDSVLHFNVPAGQYYLAILHRNHLSTMTATKQTFQNGVHLDFIDTTLQVYGTCMINLGSGNRGMISGDINQDMQLKYSGTGNDRSLILQRILTSVGGTAINATTTGYFEEDLRMDGILKYSGSGNDPSLIIQNIIALTQSNAINGVFSGVVPHAINLDPFCTPQPDPANAGSDSMNIPGTSVMLQANQPSSGTGAWSVISGLGGNIAETTNNNTSFSGQAGITYSLSWTISNPCGWTCDTIVLSFMEGPTYPVGYVHCNPANPTAIVDVVNPITGKTWMDRNLGASQVATSATDTNAYGDLFQWGRFADGHQCRTSSSTTTLSSTDQPGHGYFIKASSSPYDWRSPQNSNLWQGVDGVNNPCPAGYRLPSQAELNNERLSWSSNTIAGAFASPLKFTVAGKRTNDTLLEVNSNGHYWSNSTGTNLIPGLYISANSSFISSGQRATGHTIRCLRDSIPPCTPQPDQAYAGPDSLNIAGTSVILQANQPLNGTGLWTILSGTGGSIEDSSFHNTLFTGQVGNAYSLIWSISNQCGSTRDTVIISFVDTSAYTCGGILTDSRDGQQYPTVQIGTQCWMARNLNIGIKANSISTGSYHSNVTNNGIIEKYCYNNDAANCAIYGGLYDWNEMMNYTNSPGSQGICPADWHLPSDEEWNTLTDYLGGASIAGGKIKETGYNHWNTPNTGATNSTGFTTLGAGGRYGGGEFNHLKNHGNFWTSSGYSSVGGIGRGLTYNYAGVYVTNYNKTVGFSVRCLKDL